MAKQAPDEAVKRDAEEAATKTLSEMVTKLHAMPAPDRERILRALVTWFQIRIPDNY